jgi:hypothetical protein
MATGDLIGLLNLPHRQVFFVYGSPYSQGWKYMMGLPKYLESFPTGFSNAQNHGLQIAIILKQASTTLKASIICSLVRGHLAPLEAKQVQGGAASMP